MNGMLFFRKRPPEDSGTLHTPGETKKLALALLITTPLLFFLLWTVPSQGTDWYNVFYRAARFPITPYKIGGFINPPWAAILLWPLGFLPGRLAQAMNSYLNLFILSLLVVKNGGNKFTLALALTSFPFLALLSNGSVEWIPMIAFLFRDRWGLPFLMAKPQSGLPAVIIWFKQAHNKCTFFIPAIVILIVSFIIWPHWPGLLLANINSMRIVRQELFPLNYSPWPWGIPAGLILLYLSWCKNDDAFAVIATLFLVPYFAAHSMTIGFSLLAARYKRVGFVIWILLWLFVVLTNLPYLASLFSAHPPSFIGTPLLPSL